MNYNDTQDVKIMNGVDPLNKSLKKKSKKH